MAITKIGIIGVGIMGSMLALLLAENGIDVSVYDRSPQNLQVTAEKAKTEGLHSKVRICTDLNDLIQGLGAQKVFMFSLPHGTPGNGVVETLRPHLGKGDIVIDCSNENFTVTQQRQATLQPRGVSYVGMGVSGGFSGARHGPSLMPSGDDWAIDQLMPLLNKIAAKDDQGRPCVMNTGPGGSGHYVKMIHNGIEHGIMSAQMEAWEVMDKCLRLDSEDIGKAFTDWASRGEMKDNFLVAISGPMSRTKDANGNVLLHQIRDAVVQDVDNSEGTVVWANLEAIARHIPAPSLVAAHDIRLASASLSQRAAISKTLGYSAPGPMVLSSSELSLFLEDLRKALYGATLACFIQGLDLLSHANTQEGWRIDLERVAQIWRAGCIIKSPYITEMFESHYATEPSLHPLQGAKISADMKSCWQPLKHVVVESVKADARIPVLSATLEYLKYVGSVDLPTNFMKAQADSFGAHGYDLKTDPVAELLKGKHHSNWGWS